MDVLTALGLAFPAGLNAYIPLLGLALAQRFGVLQLGAPWSGIGQWWVIALVSVLLLVELFVDKIPLVDHINDAMQTVVRPAAGAVLAVAASGQVGENYPVVMVVLGVVLAGGVHAAKATARPVVNAASGGVGAPVVSVLEDVVVIATTAVAIFMPVLTVTVLVLFVWAWWRFYRRRTSVRVGV